MAFDTIIVAGGSGSRFGYKKQFIELGGIPVLKRTVACFDKHDAVKNIIVVVPEEDIPQANQILSDFTNAIVITKGGNTRQDSVMNGLKLAQTSQRVLIHDGVRPFVTSDLIDRVINGLSNADGCIPAIKVTDTLKEAYDGIIVKTLPRTGLYLVQTPQAFFTKTLIEAHENASKDYTFTDDSSLLEKAGKTVRIVDGDLFNMKITFKEDVSFAEAILKWQTG